MNNKLLIIENYNNSKFFWNRLCEKHKNFEEIINKYNGFEGNCIKYVTEEYINLDNINLIINEYKNSLVKKNTNSRLIYISTDEVILNELKLLFHFIGFEYGFYKDDINIYSSIFHEILLGNLAELISYNTKLNKNLLFQDYKLVNNYSQDHKYLLNSGKDVENEDEMFIYKVWKYNI